MNYPIKPRDGSPWGCLRKLCTMPARIFRVAVIALFVTAVSTFGQEPIRFARTPDISPDGSLIAFSYLGNIWTVETIGGVARPVTMHEAHEYFPAFSPDGRWIA